MNINLDQMMSEACNTRISIPVPHTLKDRYERVGALLKEYATDQISNGKGSGKLPIHEITRQVLTDMLGQLEKQVAARKR